MPIPRIHAAGAVGNEPHRHFGRQAGWLALTAVIGGGLALIITTLPRVLVLPAVSLLLVTAGFALAAGLALAGSSVFARRPREAGAWDIAGAFLLVGFSAALLADAGGALALVEQWLAGAADASTP